MARSGSPRSTGRGNGTAAPSATGARPSLLPTATSSRPTAASLSSSTATTSPSEILETGSVRILTTNGTTDYFYGRIADVSGEPVTAERENGAATPYAVWSPDSRRVRTFQVDQRNVTPLDSLLQYSPENGTLRPIPYTYRYSMPGENVALYEPVVIDVANGSAIRIDDAPWPHTSMMDGRLRPCMVER